MIYVVPSKVPYPNACTLVLSDMAPPHASLPRESNANKDQVPLAPQVLQGPQVDQVTTNEFKAVIIMLARPLLL